MCRSLENDGETDGHMPCSRVDRRETMRGAPMRFDWNFISRNLAKHLCLTADAGAVDRLLAQAKADATALDAPADFWTRVAAAYEDEMRRTGREQSELIVESLRRHDEAARRASGRRS